jgi:hypothetical protein
MLRISGGEVDLVVCQPCADDIGKRYPEQVIKPGDLTKAKT